MPYIGNTIRAADDYRLIDDISSGFNGNDTTFALQVAGSAPVPFPKSPQQVLISVNGVIQEPDPTGASGFNLVGTNIVFSSAPTNGHAFFGIIYATADYLNAGGNFPSGSLGAPSITFIGDENSGLYRKSGGSVGFVSDATEIANFDSNGITISSGNIIIPDSIIHNGDADTKIRFSAANTVSVETGGQTRAVIDGTGLEVTGSVHCTSDLRMGEKLKHLSDQDTFISFPSNDHIGFTTNNSTRMTIDSSGNVGIGTTTPAINLTVVGSNEEDLFQLSTGNTPGNTFAGIRGDNEAGIRIRGGGSERGGEIELAGGARNSEPAVIKFSTNTSNSFQERMRIDASGNVGIGTNNPATLLHIRSSSAPKLRIDDSDTSGVFTLLQDGTNASVHLSSAGTLDIGVTNDNAAATLTFKTRNNERLRIDSSGRLLLGTTTEGVANASKFTIADTQHCGMTIRSGTSHDGQVAFSDGTSGNDEFRGQIRYNHTSNFLAIATDAVERMRINSSGHIGIGTSSPDKILHLSHVSSPTLRLENTDTSLTSGQVIGNIEFETQDPSGIGVGVIGSVECFSDSSVGGSYGLKFRVSTSSSANYEAMRIAQDGNVSIGGQIPDTAFHIEKLTPELRVQSTNTNLGQSGTVCTYSHHTSDPTTPTGVGEVFRIKTISANANGADYSTELVSRAGSGGGESKIILGQGAVGAITFSTSSSGSTTERMRIDSGGRVGIGTSSPGSFNANGDNLVLRSSGNTGLTLSGSTGGFCSINFSNAVDTHVSAAIEYNQGTNELELRAGESDGSVTLRAGSFDRVKCFDSGDVFLGGAAGANTALASNSRGFVYDNDTSGNNQDGGNHPFVCVQHASKTSGAAAYIAFQSQGAFRGSVVESNLGNNVTYNTSSDYRLKQDEVIISDGITRLKQLKPYQFKWKDDLDYGYVDGFFAHEVGEVVKGAATGAKDEVVTQSGIDNGTYKGGLKVGDPVIQGLDYSRITPLLTAALQEAIAKIETLETKVAALEAA